MISGMYDRKSGATRSASRVAGMLTVALLLAPLPALAADESPPATLYFFVQDGCPSCARMQLVIDEIAAEYPQLEVRTLEVSGSMERRTMLLDAARALDLERMSVPAVFLGSRAWIGYGNTSTQQIREEVARCVEEACPDTFDLMAASVEEDASQPAATMGQAVGADMPTLFGVSADEVPVVASTAMIAFLDGFNPCSLWVLAFLLAMVMHTGSRKRVLLVGSVFLLVTATIYGLFIAGVVQAMALLAHVPWIRIVVVVLAIGMGAINIKDYFAFKRGVSLTIPDEQKSAIAKRFSSLTRSTQSPTMLVLTTAGLAAGIAIIELPCTAGFPVVWSNLITAAAVPPGIFGALILLYIVIYLLIELVLVAGATLTLRRIVITERGGRMLKLIGGAIMIALGVALLFSPELMESLTSMVVVFAGAVGISILVAGLNRVVRTSASSGGRS